MPRRRLPNLGLSGPLYHGLHTRCLRFAAPGYPDATQDSLPVGGQSLPGRVLTYRVHCEGFPFLSIAFSFPPSQAWPGASRVDLGGCHTQAPHRPVRAELPHTVPQVTGSLRVFRLDDKSWRWATDIASGAG